jgi:hypothetical protein
LRIRRAALADDQPVESRIVMDIDNAMRSRRKTFLDERIVFLKAGRVERVSRCGIATTGSV